MANRQIIGVYPPQIDIQDVVKGGVYTSSITVKVQQCPDQLMRGYRSNTITNV